MQEEKETIGLPLVTDDTGETIGHVKEVIVHRAKKCVVGFLLRHGWFEHPKVVPFSEVKSFADESVIVQNADSVTGIEHVSGASHLVKRKPLIGSSLISCEGHEIGRICNFYFDEHSGNLDGFDVVIGTEADSMSDPKFLELNDEVLVGKDDVVVSDDAVNHMINHTAESDHQISTIENSPPKVNPFAKTDHYIEAIVEAKPSDSVAKQFETAAKPMDTNPAKITRDGTSLIIAFNDTKVPDELRIWSYREQINRALAENQDCTTLVFDVAKIKLIPSAMLGLLVSLRQKVEKLEILNPSADVRDALKILGFHRFMTIREQSS